MYWWSELTSQLEAWRRHGHTKQLSAIVVDLTSSRSCKYRSVTVAFCAAVSDMSAPAAMSVVAVIKL